MPLATKVQRNHFALSAFGTRECKGLGVNGPSKFTAEEHRERARQCVCIAHESNDPTNKAMLLEMARIRLKLANDLEYPGGSRPE
jgi:hypothetical protein